VDLRASVDFILVRPARAANVAASCRALKNMGFASLGIVGGCPGLETKEARNLAYGAFDVLDGVTNFDSLLDATHEAQVVVGTTGRDDLQSLSARELGGELLARGCGRVAVVFGPEASGLKTSELQLCHLTAHIPTAVEHSSLNLAQAVLVMAYELRLAVGPSSPRRPDPSLAATGDVEAALGQLRAGLLAIGYLNPHGPDHILAELRGLLARAQLTRREVALLRGLGRQLTWAGGERQRRPGEQR
jgi:tRNA/rRNA methyltransferase